MKTIWKYEIDPLGEMPRTIPMPGGAFVCQIGACGESESAFFWAFVNTDNAEEPRTFTLCGTGQPMEHLPKNAVYLGSAVVPGMYPPFVWHVFELPKKG